MSVDIKSPSRSVFREFAIRYNGLAVASPPNPVDLPHSSERCSKLRGRRWKRQFTCGLVRLTCGQLCSPPNESNANNRDSFMPALSTREKLIEAGHEIFYREGFLAVGLDRLLNEVGCSKQTFYNHFDSKDDLIVAVIDEHHRWWSSELRDRIQRAAGPDPRARSWRYSTSCGNHARPGVSRLHVSQRGRRLPSAAPSGPSVGPESESRRYCVPCRACGKCWRGGSEGDLRRRST